MNETERQRLLDEEHLRLLRIGYFVAGGTTAFVALFGLVYVAMGFFFVLGLSSAPVRPHEPPPAFIGWLFGLIGITFTVVGGILATLKLLTARALGQRNGRTLCLVTAAFTCLSVPYGTALGIFTFVVLGRPSVRALFGVEPLPAAPPPPYPIVPPPAAE